MQILRWLGFLPIVATLFVVTPRFFFPLPDISDRATRNGLPIDQETALGTLQSTGLAAHPGKSGIIPLPGGTESLAARIALASYRSELAPEGKMAWRESRPSGDLQIYQQEPGATSIQQVALVLIGLLPVEWLL